jgi:CRISPR-associated exonuclease Cas4
MTRVGHEEARLASPGRERGGFRARTDGQVRASGGPRIYSRREAECGPGNGSAAGYRRPCAFRAGGAQRSCRGWWGDPTTGRAMLHRDDGLRGRMADRCPPRLQGCGPAAAALGPTPGGGLLSSRPSPLRRSSGPSAVAVDDEVHPGLGGARLAAMVFQASAMTFESIWLWVLVLAVALAVSWWLLCRRARVAEWRQRPAVLRDAELLWVESKFRSTSHWPIVARVDRAYRLPSGLVVLVELKTRSTAVVRMSDVIQLSAQRVAVEDELGVPVSDEAFVLIPGRDSAPLIARSVRLMSREQVDDLAARRRRLIDGLDRPRWPEGEHVCHGCGQRATCRSAGERLAGPVRMR